MIQDARVLQDDHLPREIVHRHSEMSQLAGALEPVVDGDRPQHALLTGPSGAGKTCIARATLDRLQEQVLDVHTAHVDCWLHTSDFRVLYKLLEGVGTTYDIHRSTPLDDLNLLRRLYAIPQVTMILITNRERDLFDPIDGRLKSRLRSSDHVQFGKYTDNELVTILSDRSAWGLDQGAVTDEQLTRMAEAACGNARDAIGVLRSAARRAERENAARIRDQDVDAAIPEARAELRQKSLDRLSSDQLAVYQVLRNETELMPKEIYARYTERVVVAVAGQQKQEVERHIHTKIDTLSRVQ